MKHLVKLLFVLHVFISACVLEAKLPQLNVQNTSAKIAEIMKTHATYKKLTPILVKRILQNYIEHLDPTKTYLIETDIKQWLEPSDDLLATILNEMNAKEFFQFEEIHAVMVSAIQRRRELEKEIDVAHLPRNVKAEEFKELKWAPDIHALRERLIRIKALQIDTASKLNEELKEKSLQRIAKRQLKYEDEILTIDSVQKERYILSKVLKAVAEALDAHTSYFTADEASQFMINVQQRLFGIGVQLRDDINGFTITKIVEGGPAAANKELKLKDRIIAVNGEPVVGMDILDAVDLIRGEENTKVMLTVIREEGEGEHKTDEKLEVPLVRAQVVLKESRYESSFEPFGDSIIAYLKLYSFYKDPDNSSSADLEAEINKLKQQYQIKGLILDLRDNSGGILSEAVNVAGLFITKGIVVSIKDETGYVQHLRTLDDKMVLDAPLMILVNRSSASASEIVAQTLQDYGRALIVGDDHTFGKGSFQTFTLNTTAKSENVNPQGEYKVTRGRYYTVSGKTPQLTGVFSDIVVPGVYSESEIGEKFLKFPLENDSIEPNFDDNLTDLPYLPPEKIKQYYKKGLQPRLELYVPYLRTLKANSALRIQNNKYYQKFLKELKKTGSDIEEEDPEHFDRNDLQLTESYNIMKDFLYLESLHSKQTD